ncbi:MAG: hypothetical protein QOF77_288 [Solirubrobacteraceae bacterium]|jgi:hypothetical protein|nr:hypothetical protein [Solirubrobacteraceae bacterium]
MAPALAVDTTTFAAVVIGVVVLGVVVAAVCAVAARDGFDHIGRGGLWSRPDGRADAGGDEQREEEIGQMLAARDVRRTRRAELGGTTRPPDAGAPAPADSPPRPAGAGDPQVAEEVRQLAIARNHRRRRAGLAPLDVEAEVARRLREL